MSGFAQAAKSLVAQIDRPLNSNPENKLDKIKVMAAEGFSPSAIFRDLRELYDECTDEDKNIKLQIQKLMLQVHGLLAAEEVQRAAPTFTLVINGDNARVNTMLCPGALTNA